MKAISSDVTFYRPPGGTMNKKCQCGETLTIIELKKARIIYCPNADGTKRHNPLVLTKK